MEKANKELHPLFEEPILGNEKIVALPAKGNEVQSQKIRNRPDRKSCIGSSSKYFKTSIHVAAELTVITFNLHPFQAGLLKFQVKEQAGACSQWAIGNSGTWLAQIGNALDALGISFGDQKALFSLTKFTTAGKSPLSS